MRISLLGFIFSVLVSSVFAQNRASSPNPPFLKWREIDTEQIRILYPYELEKEANRIIGVTNFIAKNKSASIGDKNQKLTILLHGRSMFPNAFVTTSPFRSEFYAAGIQDWSVLGSNDWLDLLAIHEYRHALQFSNADRGITKLFHILSGELGWNVSSNISIPNWFWEGDATISETLQSPSGRGRIPSFSEEQRALFLVNKNYRYQTVRNGSFVKRLPSHYPLGYTLNLYGRENFGNDIWKKVIADAGAYRRLVYPFNGAIKRHTGVKNSKQLYKLAYSDYKNEVMEKLGETALIPFDYAIDPAKKLVTEYSFPHFLSGGSYLALKSSRKETERIVSVENGSEKTLTTVGITNNNFISYGKNKIVWLENQDDLRWANNDFTKVISYDIETKLKTTLTKGTKALFAAIDQNDENLALVEIKDDLSRQLSIQNLQTQEITILNNEGKWNIGYPTFDNEGFLYYWAQKGNKVALVKHEIEKDTKAILIPFMSHTLSELSVGNKNVYFRGDFSGIDNIYAVSKKGGEIKKVTSVNIGAKMPAISQDESVLLFTNATHTGNFLAEMKVDIENSKKVNPVDLVEMEEFKVINSLNENEDILNELPTKDHKSKAYNGFFKDLRLHSWSLNGLSGYETNNSGFEANISVDDYLENNKIVGIIGYNINEERFSGGFDYSFGKFATLLNLGYRLRDRHIVSSNNPDFDFKEHEFSGGVSLPFSWVSGNYYFNNDIAIDLKNITFLSGNNNDGFGNPSTSLVNFDWQFDTRRQRAIQNLQSKYGLVLEVNRAKSFSGSNANLSRVQSKVYLPGLAKNHGLSVSIGVQKEKFTNEYQFTDVFNYPRGFRVTDNDQVSRLAFDYKLPLLYPDWGFGGLMYFKRLRANLFYDFGQLKGGTVTLNTQSMGIDILTDQKLLNLVDVPIGIRIGYRVKDPFSNDQVQLNKLFFSLLIDTSN